MGLLLLVQEARAEAEALIAEVIFSPPSRMTRTH